MGKFIMNGVPYGGGDVEANPSGTATDTLTKLGIEGTVYEIQGGGGGSSGSAYREVVLWNNPTSTASWSNPVTMTLNDDITNYHELKVVFSNQSGNAYGYITILVSEVLAHNYTQYFSNDAIGGASNYVLVNAINEITGYPKDTGTTTYYVKVIGIKYGGNLSPIIYSTEEREVGVWTDNKPLYQKTFYFELTAATFYLDLSPLNAENVVYEEGYVIHNNGKYKLDLPYYEDNNYKVYTNRVTDGMNALAFYAGNGILTWYKNGVITLQYTKTTDVAGSGQYTTLGVPAHHYDGNEKIIGTYFGETLYERTLNFTQDNRIYYIPNTTYVKKLVKHNGECTKDNFDFQIPYYDGTDYLSVGNDGNGVRICTSNYFVGGVYELTIQYTKTT